jgi:hypothetical protein
MARRKPLEQTHRGFNTQAHPSARNPTTCPTCGEMPAVGKGEKPHQVLEAHIIAQHRPDVACQREHRIDIPNRLEARLGCGGAPAATDLVLQRVWLLSPSRTNLRCGVLRAPLVFL